MILDHVPQCARVVVVLGTGAHAEVLADRDLHGVDPLPVPRGLDERIGEPEYQQILNGFLPEIVIDPVDLILAEVLVNELVQVAGRCEILSEGFLDDEPGPSPAPVQAGFPEARDRAGKSLRWQGHVEGVVGRDVVLAAQILEASAQPAVVLELAFAQSVVVEAPNTRRDLVRRQPRSSQSLARFLPERLVRYG